MLFHFYVIIYSIQNKSKLLFIQYYHIEKKIKKITTNEYTHVYTHIKYTCMVTYTMSYSMVICIMYKGMFCINNNFERQTLSEIFTFTGVCMYTITILFFIFLK